MVSSAMEVKQRGVELQRRVDEAAIETQGTTLRQICVILRPQPCSLLRPRRARAEVSDGEVSSRLKDQLSRAWFSFDMTREESE